MTFTELFFFFLLLFLQETDLASFKLPPDGIEPPESFIILIPMYNNNVKFCGEFLKKFGMRYFHGTSADFKVAFFLQNIGS